LNWFKELDHINAKWFEMAGWKISKVLLDHNQRIDTCLVKMWRTVGHSHEKFQTDLDCRVARRKRLRRLIVAELKCSVTRDTQLFFDRCKNRLSSEDLSGIPDIENSEIDEHLVEIVLLPLSRVQPSNAELMSHHTSSLAHAFLDDVV
jgi:hypothetical protein